MTAALNWNLPLVAGVGDPPQVNNLSAGIYEVLHADKCLLLHRENGHLWLANSFADVDKYPLRNRPWQVGDPVVTLDGERSGVVVETTSSWTP